MRGTIAPPPRPAAARVVWRRQKMPRIRASRRRRWHGPWLRGEGATLSGRATGIATQPPEARPAPARLAQDEQVAVEAHEELAGLVEVGALLEPPVRLLGRY